MSTEKDRVGLRACVHGHYKQLECLAVRGDGVFWSVGWVLLVLFGLGLFFLQGVKAVTTWSSGIGQDEVQKNPGKVSSGTYSVSENK